MIRWALSMFGMQQQEQGDKETERKSRQEIDEFDRDLSKLENDTEGKEFREREERERAERKREEEKLAAERKLKKEQRLARVKARKRERLEKERELAAGLERLKNVEKQLELREESLKETEKKLEEERLAKERETAEKFKDLELKLEKEEESRKEAEKKLEEERLAKERDKKVILEYEEREKQKEAELLTKIQELARQQVTQLKEGQAKERKRDEEEVASSSVSSSQQKPSEQELLIQALEQIIENPSTFIHPKPIYSETEYHENAPFKIIEDYVSKLDKRYTPGVHELFEVMQTAQESLLKVPVSELLGKISPKVVGDVAKIDQVKINVYSLDDRFRMVSKMERVLDKSALGGEPSSSTMDHHGESELIFGSSKGGNPVLLQFEELRSGGFKIKKVTEGSIKDYEEGVNHGQGIVLIAEKQGQKVYVTQRRGRSS